jgi:hypothetical protein
LVAGVWLSHPQKQREESVRACASVLCALRFPSRNRIHDAGSARYAAQPIDMSGPLLFCAPALAYDVSFGFARDLNVWRNFGGIPAFDTLTALVVAHHTNRLIALTSFFPAALGSPPLFFSHPAGYGEQAVTILAAVATLALIVHSPWALSALWIFNVCGSANLVYAVSCGCMGALPGRTGGPRMAFLIPAVAALLVTHALIFVVLLRAARMEGT